MTRRDHVEPGAQRARQHQEIAPAQTSRSVRGAGEKPASQNRDRDRDQISAAGWAPVDQQHDQGHQRGLNAEEKGRPSWRNRHQPSDEERQLDPEQHAEAHSGPPVGGGGPAINRRQQEPA
jgi:hypothetical protein